MKVKLKELRDIGKDIKKKKTYSKDEIHIQASMYPFLKEYTGYLELLDAYQAANIIDNINDWKTWHVKMGNINAKTENYKSYTYSERDIVLVKLGVTNYGYEASYVHPGIVISEGYNWVLIAPCSTGRYGKKKSNILDSNGGQDGFPLNTGIQIDNLRVIDKWRIIKKLGRLKSSKFNELTDRIIEIHHPHHHNLIKDLKTKSNTLIEENLKLKEEIVKLNEKCDNLNVKLEDINNVENKNLKF